MDIEHSSKRYLLALIALTLLALAPGCLLSLRMQTGTGDLARIGTLPERDYGWNADQWGSAPLWTASAKYRPADVVVVGDSFSASRTIEGAWQNWFIAATGLSVVTLDDNVTPVRRLLDDPAFRRNPPKLLIVETVERQLKRRFANHDCCPQCVEPTTPALPDPIATSRSSLQLRRIQRQEDLFAIDLFFAYKYMLLHLRAGGTPEPRGVVVTPIVDRSRFSNRRSDRFLGYDDDLNKVAWSDGELDAIACELDALSVSVTALGIRFALMIAPDKTTVYGPDLPELHLPNRIADIARRLHQPTLRLDTILRAEVEHGAVDVYLPDDTHWGWLGYKTAATALIAQLIERRILE